MTIGLGHYLTVAAILFTLGIFGIFLNRKNVIVILMSIELILVLVAWVTAPGIAAQAPAPPASQMSNTVALGQILYTKYVYLFEAAGLILLVAMIGAIVLTLHHKRDVKRQSVAAQVARNRESGVEVVEVETGRGLS